MRIDPIKTEPKTLKLRVWILMAIWVGFVGMADAGSGRDPVLERDCLGCHREQRLPDNLIDRRYLLRYSSARRMERALVAYLRHPTRQTSIMPSEFFLRFPMKAPSTLGPKTLRDRVRRYLRAFDVRQKLRLAPFGD